MQDPRDRLVYRVNTDDRFMQALAFLRCMKPSWYPKSYSGVRMDLEPDANVEKLLSAEGWKLQTRGDGGKTINLLLTKKKDVLVAELQEGLFHLTLFSNTFSARERISKLSGVFMSFKAKNEETDGVWVRFVYQGSNGAKERKDFIRCPSWSDVKQNYCGDTVGAVGSLVAMEDPWSRGRLMLWHGAPGTGKTFAIRALMMAWRKQFVFKVITDPEKLAAQPSYYFEVAGKSNERPGRYFSRQNGMSDILSNMDDEIEDGRDEEDSSKRTLFILEDSADLILPESRQSHYDKVGKLLNITDGLFGQGRQDVFLITFNEKVDKIDPAFTRPGRCIANVNFSAFPPEEGAQWCAQKGSKGKSFKDKKTLAELYSEHLANPVVSSELAPKQVGLRKA